MKLRSLLWGLTSALVIPVAPALASPFAEGAIVVPVEIGPAATASPTPLSSPVTIPVPAPAVGLSSPTPQLEQSPDAVYRRTNPAVVTIYHNDETGSGSIIRSDGLILTANHVVQGARGWGSIQIKTASGETFTGQVLAQDRYNDLALVQVRSSRPLPTVPLASTLGLRPGQQVFAIGSPFGRSGTMTQGVFTGNTHWGDLTTNPGLLKPGNSGGPLLNTRGELVGINKGLLRDDSGVSTSVQIARSFLQKQRMLEPDRPVAHTLPTPPSPSTSARVSRVSTQPPRIGARVDHQLVVHQVEPGSPAAQGGLRLGDRILAINSATLTSLAQLQSVLNRHPTSATLTVSRNQKLATIQLRFDR